MFKDTECTNTSSYITFIHIRDDKLPGFMSCDDFTTVSFLPEASSPMLTLDVCVESPEGVEYKFNIYYACYYHISLSCIIPWNCLFVVFFFFLLFISPTMFFLKNSNTRPIRLFWKKKLIRLNNNAKIKQRIDEIIF